MKNTLQDLNSHLFSQLDLLTNVQLEHEIKLKIVDAPFCKVEEF